MSSKIINATSDVNLLSEKLMYFKAELWTKTTYIYAFSALNGQLFIENSVNLDNFGIPSANH